GRSSRPRRHCCSTRGRRYTCRSRSSSPASQRCTSGFRGLVQAGKLAPMKPLAFWVVLVLVAVAAIAGGGPTASGDDFYSSSPGPLTSSHGALDNQQQCNDCHVNGTRDLSNDKCLACHDHQDLGARIAAGKGFHASALVKGKKCEVCHKEHKGRGFDLMGWASIKGGQKGFDHELAGWPLNGKHAQTDCAKCHKLRNKTQGLTTYMGTDRLCGAAGCHADDQPHKFQRKDMLACERCHSESVWKPQ